MRIARFALLAVALATSAVAQEASASDVPAFDVSPPAVSPFDLSSITMNQEVIDISVPFSEIAGMSEVFAIRVLASAYRGWRGETAQLVLRIPNPTFKARLSKSTLQPEINLRQ